LFGIGGFEFFLIILFAFLIFGPDKLPEIAKTVGLAINKFKKAKAEMDGVVKEEVFDPQADEPFKNPTKAVERAHGVVKEKVSRPESEETFEQRKARYEKEREQLKKRAEIDQQKQDEINVNRAKMKQEAAQKTKEQAAAPLTADELYGNVPVEKEFVRSAPANGANAPLPKKEASAEELEALASEGGCQ
jgi:TatA/E family protein of Tat protein translocase